MEVNDLGSFAFSVSLEDDIYRKLEELMVDYGLTRSEAIKRCIIIAKEFQRIQEEIARGKAGILQGKEFEEFQRWYSEKFAKK